MTPLPLRKGPRLRFLTLSTCESHPTNPCDFQPYQEADFAKSFFFLAITINCFLNNIFTLHFWTNRKMTRPNDLMIITSLKMLADARKIFQSFGYFFVCLVLPGCSLYIWRCILLCVTDLKKGWQFDTLMMRVISKNTNFEILR